MTNDEKSYPMVMICISKSKWEEINVKVTFPIRLISLFFLESLSIPKVKITVMVP